MFPVVTKLYFKDNVGEEANKNDDDYVYVYFPTGREPSRSWIWKGWWVGGIWGVTLYFISIVLFSCATHGGVAEVLKINNIQNGS